MESESRRDFLKYLGVLYGAVYAEALLAGQLRVPALHEVLLINNADRDGYGSPDEIVRTPPGSVRIFNPLNGKTEEVSISFFGHTLTQNPHQQNIVATFEQRGKRGALVDLAKRKVLAEIESAKGNTFLGHSAFSPDKKWIYTTEQNHDKRRGEISIRDSATLKYVQMIPSYGISPHDCRLIDNGSKIVVANNLGPSNISYVETSSGKLLHQVKVDEQKSMVISHFDISADQWLFGGPRTKSAFGILVSPKGKLFKLAHPGIRETGILSVAFIDGTELLVATYPEGNSVQIWNYKTQQPVGSVQLPNPRGVLPLPLSPSGEPRFLISLARAREVKILVVSKSKAVSSASFGPGFGGSGSHLVRALIDC